jgi:hypothetical protein
VSPDPVPSGSFVVAEALAAGATRDMLRRRSLVAPVRGVRMSAGAASDVLERCHAIGLVLPDEAAFSHATAAAAWGLPLPPGVDPLAPVHVIGPPGRPPVQARGIVAHRGVDPGDVRRRDGLPLTAPARILADVAGSWPTERLVALADGALALASPRTTRADLEARAAAGGGRRGVRRLRVAVQHARRFVDSPMESLTRVRLVGSGFPCPVVGADLYDDLGCWIARPDMCWPEIRVAVEYDGDHHRADRWQYVKDIRRKEHMEDAGWRCVVLLAEDVLRRWPLTEARLRDVFASRGVRPEDLVDAPDSVERPRVTTPRRP